jgi:hypothetical protein
LQVEFVARLANSLGVELVKAEALRAMRERPNNPDAIDLWMRGSAELEHQSKASQDAAVGLFERALELDPQLVPAMGRHRSDDPTYNARDARIIEGLRKAGLPEGEKKTN